MSPNNLRTADLGKGCTDSLIQFPTLFSITEGKRVKSLPAAYKDMCEPISLPNLKTTTKQIHQRCECERKNNLSWF